MDFKIELVMVPVSDPDVAKDFYVNQAGFHLDVDQEVNEDLRFIQLTPPGSACSIAIGTNMSPMQPGTLKALQAVVEDIEATRSFLVGNGIEVTEIDDMPWGRFCFFQDPDGNAWSVQQLPPRGDEPAAVS